MASSLPLSDTEKVRKEKIPENGPDSPPKPVLWDRDSSPMGQLKKVLLDVVTYTPLISACWWQRHVDLREFEVTLL